jgi:fumarate reductase subunit D
MHAKKERKNDLFIKCHLDATDDFIADLIACPTCFGHHYAHHQELESIIQVIAACGIWCFGFQVVGMVWSLFAGCFTAARKPDT